MSQELIKELLQSPADEIRCEKSSSETSTPSFSLEAEDTDELSCPESDDDEAPASEATDSNQQDIQVDWTHPRIEVAGTDEVFSLDLPKSTCGGSDLDRTSILTFDSDEWIPMVIPVGCYSWFKFQVRKIRRKGWLLPFEIICLAFTLTCCYLGAYNWFMCPADVLLPRYVFINGAIATFALCAEMMDTIWKIMFPHSEGNVKYFFAFGIGWIAIITTFIEMIEFYTMPYSFHRNEENYCDETFYWFVYYKNIASGVLMFLTAVIYFPSFSIVLYCMDDDDDW